MVSENTATRISKKKKFRKKMINKSQTESVIFNLRNTLGKSIYLIILTPAMDKY